MTVYNILEDVQGIEKSNKQFDFQIMPAVSSSGFYEPLSPPQKAITSMCHEIYLCLWPSPYGHLRPQIPAD